jgi:hypothetical protein
MEIINGDDDTVSSCLDFHCLPKPSFFGFDSCDRFETFGVKPFSSCILRVSQDRMPSTY